MSAEILNISEIDTKELFRWRRYMLGNPKGRYIVVDGAVYLGIYEERHVAQEHVDSLNSGDKPTKDDLDKALEFAKNLKEDES